MKEKCELLSDKKLHHGSKAGEAWHLRNIPGSTCSIQFMKQLSGAISVNVKSSECISEKNNKTIGIMNLKNGQNQLFTET